MMQFIRCLVSEWLKTKRSFASWLSLIGGFFIPTIFIIYFLYQGKSINSTPKQPWEAYFMKLWQLMGSFLLPMGVVMASSLLTQMEYKNNTWKQLHTTPQSLSTIFFAKLSVIMLLTLQFFIFFNIGYILSGAIPGLIFDHRFPTEQFPLLFILKMDAKFFLACLPIIALQYLVSLRFRNFLIPIGIGVLGIIGTMIAYSWNHIYLSPFSYCLMVTMPKKLPFACNTNLLAFACFIIITALGYLLYINKNEKG